MKFSQYLLIAILCCLCYGEIHSQRPISRNPEIQRDSSKIKRPIDAIFSPPDSLEISVYHAQKPEVFYAYPDTLLNDYFQQSDPTREQIVDYSYLGSLGNPAQPTFFKIEERKGLYLGFRQFDLYTRPVDSIRYFKVNRTFTDTYYAQGRTKDDFIFKGTFTRNLSKQLNFSADYNRISHVGFYEHQKSRHTAFTINTAYQHKNKKYKSYLSYTFNDIQQEDNGGVSNLTLFNEEFYQDRSNIPTFLSSANTRMKGHDFSYTHYYDLLQPKHDSLGLPKRHLTLGHQMLYTTGSYKFFDKNLDDDAIYYQHLQVDDRGLRHYLDWNKLENTFKVSTYKSDENKDRPKDLFSVGITQIFQKTYQEPRDTSYNALYVIGSWEYNPVSFLLLETSAHYGLGNASNEYMLKGVLSLNIPKIGRLKAKVLNQRFSPDLLHDRIYISKREIYNTSFKKPITTSVEATLQIPVSKTQLSAKYHILNQHIYYDTLGFAQQISNSVNVLQLVLQQDFSFRPFGMENTIAFQADDSDFIRAPKFSMKNSLFVEGKVFKKVMLARLGFDFRMNTSYFANTYQPVLGQFHLQDDNSVELYPSLDFFLSFKVQTLRAYLKMVNITDWFTKKTYFQIPGYPMPDAHFRFGISWRFID